MVVEASRIVQERQDLDPRDVDLGALLGIGFPQTKGGVLWWADRLEPKLIVEMLRPLEGLGPRWKATPVLCELAAANRTFYELTAMAESRYGEDASTPPGVPHVLVENLGVTVDPLAESR